MNQRAFIICDNFVDLRCKNSQAILTIIWVEICIKVMVITHIDNPNKTQRLMKLD